MQAAVLEVADAGWTSGFAHALTWTLVHSLWVGASAALCLFAFTRLLPAKRARWRYAASAGALFSVPLVALGTLARELIADGREFWIVLDAPALVGSSGSWMPWESQGGLLLWANGLRALLAARLAPFEELISLSWISLAALALLRVAGGLLLIGHAAGRDHVRASARTQARVARLAQRIGLGRRVGIYWSERAEVPMVVGALRPRIVVPASMAAAAGRGELDPVLLHELAHVRRGDGFSRLVEAILQAVFVVHPVLPWLAARVAREREHCCDDIALAAGADRLGYVRTLAAIEGWRRAQRIEGRGWWRASIAAMPAMRATDGPLVERVRRLTSRSPRAPGPRLAAACLALVLGSLGLALGALPTHDTELAARVAGERRITIERDFDLSWAQAEPGHAADAGERRIARMIVLAHDRDALPPGELELLIAEDLDFLRELPAGEGPAAAGSTKARLRVRAIR